ncbi:peroxisomal catalase [Grosmannia clavigera kw1407]|uniref:Catalase n=1 Tax=Grosmannia clavigera (strain kw1407 / UAMH 11150) TaxID=655863 RepID=F0XU99_GROCL|nr:peroxisomal catalase [Grosmannia clavigera kw1407]EFW98653.1 peroxisomal catalase [Grosmannia clavigera kw1407]
MAANDKAPSTYRYDEKPVYTTSNGCPIDSPTKYQRISNGPLLLQDFHLIDLLAHFDRERVPERVVHAKGAGAFGEFELTHDLSDITSIGMLTGAVGKKTPLVARFSTVGGEKGSADSARDPRGFSLKFYTDEGNWDWVFNNTPVFFLRDPTNFPEAAHQVMHLFSDRGTPYSYRHMNGYSGHTYKFTKPDGSFVYVQVHAKTDQGSKTFDNETAGKLAGENPDWHTQDLFEAIERGEHPSWTVYVQVLTPEQAEKFRWNIFDLTKVWPQGEVPLRPVGRFRLTRNPENYFAQIEQAAFSPSHMVPGVEPTADPVLQSRLFSYPDTHRHRLGTNYQQIPVNRPLRAFNPFHRDGAMAVDGNYGANPNYESSYRALTYKPIVPTVAAHEKWVGAVSSAVFADVSDEDFVQPNALWKVLGRTAGQQDNFVHNVAGHLSAAKKDTRERTYGMFSRIDADLGRRIKKETEAEANK